MCEHALVHSLCILKRKPQSGAEGWLEKAQDAAERTHVISVACHEAFAALETKMRFFKDRYFKMPPLTREDWAALGFKEKDDHRTPAGEPTAQVTAETFLRGPGELGFRIVYVSGDPHDRANSGYRVWYGVVAPGEAPPANPGELRKSFFTRRKRDFIEFEYGDAGKAAYIAVQIENGSGKQGKFGPMVQAVIP
ncbi:MAG: hypothetical protein LBB48_06140 [Treponema sp.]|nr:hypothetical protein [Treponema sp.]